MKKAAISSILAVLAMAVVSQVGAQSAAPQYKFFALNGRISSLNGDSITLSFDDYSPCPIPSPIPMIQGIQASSAAPTAIGMVRCWPCVEPMVTNKAVPATASDVTLSGPLPNIYPLPPVRDCDRVGTASRAPVAVTFQNVLVLDQGDQVLTSSSNVRAGDIVRIYFNGDSVYMLKRVHSKLCGVNEGGCPRPVHPILRLQQELKDRGFFPVNVSTTGTLGPITKQAILDFQAKNGIPKTGTAGPITLKALGISQ